MKRSALAILLFFNIFIFFLKDSCGAVSPYPKLDIVGKPELESRITKLGDEVYKRIAVKFSFIDNFLPQHVRLFKEGVQSPVIDSDDKRNTVGFFDKYEEENERIYTVTYRADLADYPGAGEYRLEIEKSGETKKYVFEIKEDDFPKEKNGIADVSISRKEGKYPDLVWSGDAFSARQEDEKIRKRLIIGLDRIINGVGFFVAEEKRDAPTKTKANNIFSFSSQKGVDVQKPGKGNYEFDIKFREERRDKVRIFRVIEYVVPFTL